jgi:O-antigen/teichoic acid export membrane protein
VLLPLVLTQHLDIIPFFLLQLLVSTCETGVLLILAVRVFPDVLQRRVQPSLKAVRPLIPAATAIAATGVLWLLVSQVDRLVLSAVLSLSDYALYSLAVAAAGGVTVAINPLIAALLPAYCRQYASTTMDDREESYRRVVEIVAGATALVAGIIGVLSYDVLLLWTRDVHVASYGAPVVMAYALGNFAQTVAGLPYFVQFAAGNLRMHVIGSVLFVIAYVPGTIVVASKYGAVGVGLLWLAMNVVYIVAWVPIVHARFLPGLRNPVFFLRVLKYPLLCGGTAYLVAALWPRPEGLWLGVARIFGATVLAGLVMLLFSIPLRRELKGMFARLRRVEIQG